MLLNFFVFLDFTMIGEGECLVEGQRLPASQALSQAGLKPLSLGPKDGLAICNASAFSSARAALALADRWNRAGQGRDLTAAALLLAFAANAKLHAAALLPAVALLLALIERGIETGRGQYER